MKTKMMGKMMMNSISMNLKRLYTRPNNNNKDNNSNNNNNKSNRQKKMKPSKMFETKSNLPAADMSFLESVGEAVNGSSSSSSSSSSS